MIESIFVPTLNLSIFELVIYLLIAMFLGWFIYGLRGYEYWLKRFHRYGGLPAHPRNRHIENIPTLKASVTPSLKKTYSSKDDLKIIEGIGPKIEEILNNNAIHSWETLARTSVESLRNILARAGTQYKMHDPKTWSHQAHMASTGSWEELQEYQEFLHSGH